MTAFLSFLSFGLLIGVLTGFSSDSIAKNLVSLLFTFVGGSVIVLIIKFSEQQLRVALKCVAGISVGGLIGVIAAIYINEGKLLSPLGTRMQPVAERPGQSRYLRGGEVSKVSAIIQQVDNGDMTKSDGYNEIETLAIVRILNVALNKPIASADDQKISSCILDVKTNKIDRKLGFDTIRVLYQNKQ